jgi:phosphoribosylformylglycinamidine (FGAM) synthase-like enzyme
VPPTLVITAVAHVPDAERCITTELRAPGNVLLQVGPTGEHFAGSHLDLLGADHRTPSEAAGIAPWFDDSAPSRYRALHQAIRRGLVQSCHDVAEGGLAVAIAEMCIASGRGARIDELPHPDVTSALFSETAGRLVVEVAPDDLDTVRGMLDDTCVLGTVHAEPVLDIAGVATIDVARLADAFAGDPL